MTTQFDQFKNSITPKFVIKKLMIMDNYLVACIEAKGLCQLRELISKNLLEMDVKFCPLFNPHITIAKVDPPISCVRMQTLLNIILDSDNEHITKLSPKHLTSAFSHINLSKIPFGVITQIDAKTWHETELTE